MSQASHEWASVQRWRATYEFDSNKLAIEEIYTWKSKSAFELKQRVSNSTGAARFAPGELADKQERQRTFENDTK